MALEIISAVLSLSEQCYNIAQQVKQFKGDSKRLADRVQLLNEPIQLAKSLSSDNQLNDYDRFLNELEELKNCIVDINEFLQRIAEMTTWKKVWEKGDIAGGFNDFNARLDDLVPGLILIMEIEKREEFMRKMNEVQDTQDIMLDDVEEIKHWTSKGVTGIEDINRKMDKQNSQNVPQDLKEINIQDLEQMKKQPSFEDGTFGELYIAKYKLFGGKVAVKKLFEGQDIKRNLREEAMKLKKFDSPNIVRLWGICTEGNNNMIVFEYMENGHLRKFLDENSQLTNAQRLQMASNAASSLFYVHNQKWLHRNLTSMKYLVGNNFEVKLSDVGFSKTWESARKYSTVQSQAKRYHAPELLKSAKQVYDFKCEIYCFGIVLWEIFTGKEPYKGMSPMDIMESAKKEELLPMDNLGSHGELISKCMAGNPLERPTMNEITDELEAIKHQDCEQKTVE
ncbi:mixed lineage kinase domain-like protein [Anneissia japonica]|uniref:mixed lineage kinase domain-like protein n=1 Tax=Anneissia japonica TaxID=1529436 RepID=UPI001425787A|nr:mixed lineage kinase domain-like protein [Anneissia japonica]